MKTPTDDVGRGLTIAQAKALLAAAKGERLEALHNSPGPAVTNPDAGW